MLDLEHLTAFKRAIDVGSPIPAVDPDDLSRIHEVFTDAAKNRRAVGIEGLATVCSPGADVEAVCFRSWLLDALMRHGELTDWLQNPQQRAVVYRVAAAIPISGIQLDPAAFRQRLEQEQLDL